MELFKSRTRVVYTNAVGDKVYPVVVDIKKGIKSTEDIQFVSSDVNTGILSVAFIQGNDNYNVTGADVVCSVMRPDASTLELPCEVVGENIVEVPLGINGTSQDGVYSFDFKVFKGENKVVGTPIMSYSVSLSIDNDTVVEEDDRLPVLTVLMTQLTELKGEARESITQANTATVASREATAKAIEATANANTVSERVSQETSEAISRVDNKVNEVETRFNALTTSQQQDAEVIDARDGEVSLKARLDRDIEKAKQVYVELEGSYISTESSTGAIQDLEILGNTVQDPNNLSDIKSVGELQEDGTYKMSILSCGKNLFNPLNKNIEYSLGGSQNKVTYKVEGDKIIIKSNPSVSSDWGWVEFKNIKVTPNKSYTIHPNATVIKGNVCVFVFDSNNTKLFEIPNTSKTFIPTTKHITIRLYVQTTTSYTDAEIHYKPQLEEGTQATPYEPYQENKCDILLPCQLEKVGDVSDRLYYDDVEKAWCIEKNIETVVLNGSENWLASSTKAYYWITPTPAIVLGQNKLISNTLKTSINGWDSSDKTPSISSHSSLNNIYLNYVIDEVNNISMLKMWLQANPTLVKYQLATPRKIVLPLNTQIALNSFFGTTHVYMESGEVEGTIKCKIPKSLGATVQSLNNKTDILSDRIEAIEGLKDSQNMKYETDKGYLVCKETKNGVIDDLKIEGKTLVNLAPKYSIRWTHSGTWLSTFLVGTENSIGSSYKIIQDLKSNTEYTVIVNIKTNTQSGNINLNNYQQNTCVFKDSMYIKPSDIGVKTFKVKTVDSFDHINPSDMVVLRSQSAGIASGETLIEDIMILEGDHTQNPPSYFEGLKSVGQDVDEIEVSSSNKNLLNEVEAEGYYRGYVHGELTVNKDYNSVKGKVIPNTRYVLRTGGEISNSISNLCFFDKNFKFISGISNSVFDFTTPMNCRYITIAVPKAHKEVQLELGDTPTKYIPPQSDKKQILYYNENGELEPIQELHEWDSIEKHSDNKWYYHKRSGKVVLTQDNSFSNPTAPIMNTTKVYQLLNVAFNAKAQIICDKFKVETRDMWHIDEEAIWVNSNGTLYIRINKSKLSTQDVQGFKQWLQTNNVTVVYQLAEEEVYELAPLHLDSYANETLILCNSGAISPKMEFSITSHINNLVLSNTKRINALEEKVFSALKQVLAGDMYSLAELLYPEDFVEENPENEIMLLPFE